MRANAERADRRTSLTGEHSLARRVRRLTVVALVLLGAAGSLEVAQFGRVVSGWPAELVSIIMLGLAGLAILTRHQAIVALSDRLDILNWALDSAPAAQLIVAADGRIRYGKPAFRVLFPGSVGPPLDVLKRAVTSDPESEARFRRLCGRVAARVPAVATLTLSRLSSPAVGRFKVKIDPVTDHPGYSYWNIED